MIENERRFLVDPSKLDAWEGNRVMTNGYNTGSPPERKVMAIQQYYLTDSSPSVRVRKTICLWHDRPKRYELTAKGPGTMSRVEHTIVITEKDALPLIDMAKEKLLKFRHYYSINGVIWELDEFQDGLKDLWLAEVEGEIDMVRSVSPPSFCGREVTEEREYSNAYLARMSRVLGKYKKDHEHLP